MTGEQWARLAAARELLGLGERATLAEIKGAYRKLCKQHHPDLSAAGDDLHRRQDLMRRLTEAYQELIDYCSGFHFPLVPPAGEEVEPDDWWMDRFGDDPLWGPGRKS